MLLARQDDPSHFVCEPPMQLVLHHNWGPAAHLQHYFSWQVSNLGRDAIKASRWTQGHARAFLTDVSHAYQGCRVLLLDAGRYRGVQISSKLFLF